MAKRKVAGTVVSAQDESINKARDRGAMLALSPPGDTPREKLRSLVRYHKALTKRRVAIENMSSDHKKRDTKEIIKCPLSKDMALEFKHMCKVIDAEASALVPGVNTLMKQFEVHRVYLSKVFGLASGICVGYLLADINIRHQDELGRPIKPSNLRRYCGLAVVDGKSERAKEGQKNRWNKELRCRIWQIAQSMRKNAAKITMCGAHREKAKALGKKPPKDKREALLSECYACAECKTTRALYGWTNKYLDIWYNAKMGALAAGMTPGKADDKGRRKMCDVLLLDLYTVWRATEGLEVWPSYYEHRIGPGHRGWHLAHSTAGATRLTVEAAMLLVGDIKLYPLKEPRRFAAEKDEESGEATEKPEKAPDAVSDPEGEYIGESLDGEDDDGEAAGDFED